MVGFWWRERLLLGVLCPDFPVLEIEKEKIGRSLVINRLGRGASRESGAFMVSGIKVKKMNLSSRGLVLLKIKAREMTLGPEVRYRVCCDCLLSFGCRLHAVFPFVLLFVDFRSKMRL